MWLTIMRHWVRYRLIFKILFFSVVSLGMYLGMSPTPVPTSASWHSYSYHAGGLFACTILSFLAFPRWYWWVRGLLMFSVGLSVEYVQSFQPTRYADLTDIYANTAGVAAGMACVALFQWWRGSQLN
jgi:VanZ family protein